MKPTQGQLEASNASHIDAYVDSINIGQGRGSRGAGFYGSPGLINVSRDGGMAKLYITIRGVQANATLRIDRAELLVLIEKLQSIAGE